MQQKANECGLPADGEYSLDGFLEFYGSFGSIFDVRQLDQTSENIIIKPLHFFKSIDHFLTNVDNENGIIMCKPEEKEIVEVMASVSLAVRLPDPKTNMPSNRYYFHSIRRGHRKTWIDPGTVQFVLSMASPRINKDAEIIKLLLSSWPNAELEPGKWTSSVYIVIREGKAESHYIKIFSEFSRRHR